MPAGVIRDGTNARVIHLVSSSGGHIDLLAAVRDALDGYRRVWVVQPSHRADLLAREGEEVHVLPQYDRHPIRGHYLQNAARALALVLRQRPRIVVTSGAGVTVPFCVLARVFGAQLIFIETMARVTGPSASGRVLSRLASRVVVQWPEAMPAYPRPRLCHPALLEGVAPSKNGKRRGTFVAVGTHSQPFDRLLRLVDEAAAAGRLPKPVSAQIGVSKYRPRSFSARAWMSPTEVERSLASAKCVISHAGSGLISGALGAGRRPLVLPRLARHGEHFDDHQVQLVAKLAELDLVVPISREIGLVELARASAPLPNVDTTGTPSVSEALRQELASLLGPPGADAGRPENLTDLAPRMRPAGLGAGAPDEPARVGADF